MSQPKKYNTRSGITSDQLTGVDTEGDEGREKIQNMSDEGESEKEDETSDSEGKFSGKTQKKLSTEQLLEIFMKQSLQFQDESKLILEQIMQQQQLMQQSVRIQAESKQLMLQFFEHSVQIQAENKSLLSQVCHNVKQIPEGLHSKKDSYVRPDFCGNGYKQAQKGDEFEQKPGPVSNNSYLNDFFSLGGKDLKFNPRGQLHPVAYIRKLKELFRDAEVPSEKKVRLALLGLKGLASEWGDEIEEKIENFNQFEEAFLGKYWNVETQRETHDKLKFGRWVEKNGSRVNYFKSLVKEAKYLSTSFTENKLIELFVPHFPVPNQLFLKASPSLEDFERQLQWLDDHNVGLEQNFVANSGQGENNWRQRGVDRQPIRPGG